MWSRVVVAVACLVHVSPVPARPIEDWSYERLFKEADVVVIAKPESTADVDTAPADPRMRRGFVGQRTAFSLVSTLKGEAKGTSVQVLHFRLRDGVMPPNGPLLITFRTKPVRIEGKARGDAKRAGDAFVMEIPAPHYLLFLKAGENGRLEPVSGQDDQARSEREETPPLP
jgi:hypothetical protein